MNRLCITAMLLFALGMSVANADGERDDYAFNAADAIYDAASMRAARAHLRHEHGDLPQAMLSVDRLEILNGDAGDTLLWDIEAWYGDDRDKVILKPAGLASLQGDGLEEAELQLLWSHALTPFFDLRTGVRYDFEPTGLGHLVFGLVGFAPYWLDLDATAYLSADGDLTAGVDIEYEWLFSQRLALLSRTEIAASAQAIPELETGSGLTEVSQGLRLRYALTGRFVPYLGVQWQRALGDTADFVAAAGDDASDVSLIIGVNFWF